jgi:DNA invertase Pin-like site-specific DNA recombinase
VRKTLAHDISRRKCSEGAGRDGRQVLDEMGAKFRSLTELWADTTTSDGGLILRMLAKVAEFERASQPAGPDDGSEAGEV